MNLQALTRRNDERPKRTLKELLHNLEIASPLAGKGRLGRGVLEIAKGPEHEPLVHWLPIDLSESPKNITETHLMGLEQHVEIKEVAPGSTVQDRVSLRRQKPVHGERSIFSVRSELRQEKDRDIHALECEVNCIGALLDEGDLTCLLESPEKPLQLRPLAHPEIDVVGRTVRHEAPNGLPSYQEPIVFALNCLGDDRWDDLEG